MLKYRDYLIAKTIGDADEFDKITEKILARMKLVDNACLKPFFPAAKTLISDEKDWLYLACALKEDTIIWSQDKDFQGQRRVPIKTTAQLAKELGKLRKN